MKLLKFVFKQNIPNNLLFGLLYIFTFSKIWRDYCVPVWDAYRYEYYHHSVTYEVCGYFVALFPIVFYRGIRNISSWISIILYFFGYVPVIIGLLHNFPENNSYDVVSYWIVLLISMSLYFYSDRSKWRIKPKKRKLSIKFIRVLVVISFIILFGVYHNNMRLVSLEDVYGLRAENAGDAFPMISYIQAWAVNFTFPFVFCYGLYYNVKKYILVGSLLFLFLYSIFGLKSTLFAPMIIWGLYKFFDYQDKYNLNLVVLLSLAVSSLSFFMMYFIDNPIVYALAAVFLMRTVSISGNLFACYYLPFFKDNPHTYFTHINIIDYLTGANPYHGQSLGTVVSESDMNANAIFWAMDGVAGAGVTGVAIVSFLFLLVLYFINSITNKDNLKFACILFIMPAMALLNVSLFTFILSNGALFIILTLMYIKIKPEN